MRDQSSQLKDEQAVFAKCTWRLIPLVVLLFTVNFLDRVNVGFAALTMSRDLGFSFAVFGFGAGVFFLGYFLFQIPSNLVLARVGARRWIFFITALWGVMSSACALVQGPASFYVLRFLLGVAEAGFFPGVLFYLTLWFPHSYRARFAASLVAAGPFAGVIGGPLSGLLLGMDGIGGLHGWQWLFLIEGLPAIVLSLVVLAMLSDRPASASWLDEEEKDVIARRLAAESATKAVREFWPALLDPRVLALALVAFGMQSGLFGVGLWLPQIVQAMGFSTLSTGFVVAPLYLASAAAMILWGRSSDRSGERVWHLALAAFLGTAGFLAASAAPTSLLALVAIGIGMIGIHCTFGPFWGIPTSFLGDRATAGGVALINSIGSLGGFFAPAIIGLLRGQSGGYGSSMVLLAGALAASGVIVLALARSLPSGRRTSHGTVAQAAVTDIHP
jgi:ACS family tartrate transporter-like MFS transporter